MRTTVKIDGRAIERAFWSRGVATRADMAVAVGIHPVTFQNLIAHKKTTPQTLYKIAKYLDRDMNDFILEE